MQLNKKILPPCPLLFCCFVFKIRSHHVAQANIILKTLLPQSLECRNSRMCTTMTWRRKVRQAWVLHLVYWSIPQWTFVLPPSLHDLPRDGGSGTVHSKCRYSDTVEPVLLQWHTCLQLLLSTNILQHPSQGSALIQAKEMTRN